MPDYFYKCPCGQSATRHIPDGELHNKYWTCIRCERRLGPERCAADGCLDGAPAYAIGENLYCYNHYVELRDRNRAAVDR